jgi:DNA-binding transcriptional LysR family regulator
MTEAKRGRRPAVAERLARIPLELASRQLVYLAVIGELGSVGRAAEALNLTQPALSKAIRGLERALRVQLLTRTTRGVVPTAAGESLLKHAHEVVASLRRARAELERLRGVAPGRAQVGVARGVPASLFGAAFGRVAAAFPAAAFVVVENTNRGLLAALEHGELDVAVLAGTVAAVPAHVTIEPVAADRGAVVARPDHPAARRGGVALDDLATARWVLPPGGHPLRLLVDDAFAAQGRAPKLLMQTGSLALATEVVARTDALAMLPASAVAAALGRGELVEIACRGLDWALPLAVAVRTPGTAPAPARALYDELRAPAVPSRPAPPPPPPTATRRRGRARRT